MSCTNPLKAWQIGTNSSGKPNYKISGYTADHVERVNGIWINAYESFVSPHADRISNSFIEIPCGKCQSCRLSQAKQWSERCLLELQDHEQSYFLTLTYDDNNLPTVESYDKDGLVIQTGNLVKSDFQKFMKKLRKHYEEKYSNKIRYFACGEYGESTQRPHFHVIMFGLKLDDLKLYKRNNLGQNLYTSEWLSNIWKNGYVVIGEVTEQSISYTCRYVLKKASGIDKSYYQDLNLEPEFTLMSRKPGIARRYYDDNKDKIFSQDSIYVGTKNGSKKIRPSRYYEKLYENDFPTLSAERKLEKMADATISSEIIMSHTSLDYLSQKDVEGKNLESKLKALHRKGV